VKYIFGKHETQKTFRAMDINKGECVRNIVKATRLTDEEAEKFMKTEAPRNPDWQFEAREVVT
jgi:hypothetical protein